MSDEVGAIYATLSLQKAAFDAGLDEARLQMAATAAEMDGASADISGAADAMAADIDGVAADVTGAFAEMGAAADGMAADVDAVAADITAADAEMSAAADSASIDMIAAFSAVAGFLSALLLPAMIAVVAGLVAVGAAAIVMFGPLAAGMAAVAAIIGYFDIWSAKSKSLGGQIKFLAVNIFDWFKMLAQEFSKPILTYLLAQMHALNSYVHTMQFRQDVKHWAAELLDFLKTGRQVVNWFISNWPEMEKIAKKTIHVFALVAGAVQWLYHEFVHYWPQIESTVKTVYNWFMTNLWPGLHTILTDIGTDASNLAAGFQQAWPQIKSAAVTAYTAMKPVLGGIVLAFEGIQAALSWLSKNSGSILQGFATGVQNFFGWLGPIIQGVAAGLENIVSALQTAYSVAQKIAGVVGGGGVPHGSHSSAASGGAHATGGVINPGMWGMVGERGPEMIQAGGSPIHVTPTSRVGGSRAVPVMQLVYQGFGTQADAQRFARWLAPELKRVNRGTLTELALR